MINPVTGFEHDCKHIAHHNVIIFTRSSLNMSYHGIRMFHSIYNQRMKKNWWIQIMHNWQITVSCIFSFPSPLKKSKLACETIHTLKPRNFPFIVLSLLVSMSQRHMNVAVLSEILTMSTAKSSTTLAGTEEYPQHMVSFCVIYNHTQSWGYMGWLYSTNTWIKSELDIKDRWRGHLDRYISWTTCPIW